MLPLIVKQLYYDFTPSNSDVLRSYLGLLVQGMSDFYSIESYREMHS